MQSSRWQFSKLCPVSPRKASGLTEPVLRRDLRDVGNGGVGATQRAMGELHATKTYIGYWTHAQMFAATTANTWKLAQHRS